MNAQETPDAVREGLSWRLERIIDDGGPLTLSDKAVLREALAALDSRAGDAGEAISALRALLVIAGTPITERQEAIFRRANAIAFPTPAPAVDADEGYNPEAKPDRVNITPEHNEALHGALLASSAAVDAVPAGEVERLARIRTSMALLQQNSEGCAQNHYGDDAAVHGMPGWLIDTKADLDAFTDILARQGARS